MVRNTVAPEFEKETAASSFPRATVQAERGMDGWMDHGWMDAHILYIHGSEHGELWPGTITAAAHLL